MVSPTCRLGMATTKVEFVWLCATVAIVPRLLPAFTVQPAVVPALAVPPRPSWKVCEARTMLVGVMVVTFAVVP
jgi:hypothetical protein